MDWIAHDGRGCPVPVGQFVEVRYLDGLVHGYVIDAQTHEPYPVGWDGNCWFWFTMPVPDLRVVAYRFPGRDHVEALKASIRDLEMA